MKTASVARLTHESSLQAFLLRKQVLREAKCILVPRARRFLVRWSGNSGRKNVISMRELFCPDPLAGFEKMAGFQIIYCLKIKCFHS